MALCSSPEGDGKTTANSASCTRFSPRMSCTTCGNKCSQEDKEVKFSGDGTCHDWKLKKLSSWGGSRRHPEYKRSRMLKQRIGECA